MLRRLRPEPLLQRACARSSSGSSDGVKANGSEEEEADRAATGDHGLSAAGRGRFGAMRAVGARPPVVGEEACRPTGTAGDDAHRPHWRSTLMMPREPV
eukprot:scaffold116512_cov87-Phaeocystis_antarctica.AAC.2